MKNALVFAIFICVLAFGLASVSSGFYRDPNHPGMCVITSDIIVPSGTHQYPGNCARIECSNGFAEIADCGVQLAAPGCTLGDVENPDADYPDCCMRHVNCP